MDPSAYQSPLYSLNYLGRDSQIHRGSSMIVHVILKFETSLLISYEINKRVS